MSRDEKSRGSYVSQEERDDFIADLIANPEKYRAEWTAKHRRERPDMTEEQIQASWDQAAFQLGLASEDGEQDERGAAAPEVNMGVFKNPYVGGTHHGCVVRTWNAQYENDSDEFATCWDVERGEFVEVCVGGATAASWDGMANEDATPDVLAKWEALPARLKAEPVPPVTRHRAGEIYAWRSSIDADPPPDRFAEALAFACRMHRPQTRKGIRTPYVSHLLAVASLVLEYDGDEDQAIAALLHDAMEDQGGQAIGEEIRRRFGPAVYQIVEDCSDAIVEDRANKPPWRERKERYVKHVASCSPRTKLVSAADKLHNARATLADLRDFGPEVWNRFNASREDTLWYYGALVTAFRTETEGVTLPGRTSQLIDELARTVDGLEKA